MSAAPLALEWMLEHGTPADARIEARDARGARPSVRVAESTELVFR